MNFNPLAILLLVAIASSSASAQWCPEQVFSTIGSNIEFDDRFPGVLSMAGGVVVVGKSRSVAPGAELEDPVLVFDARTGEEIAALIPPEILREFGQAVASNGEFAVVGSPRVSAHGNSRGVVYLFDLKSGSVAQVIAPGSNNILDFGASVDLSSTLAVVGAPRERVGESTAGTARLVDLRTGEILRTLIPDDSGHLQYFGNGVAIDGTSVIVTKQHRQPFIETGAAYIFDAVSGEQRAKLLPDDLDAEDRFAGSYDIDGTVAAIGAPWDGDTGARAGAVYLFDLSGRLIEKIRVPNSEDYDLFGTSVAIDGTTLLVGSPGDDDRGANSGSVYVFDLLTGDQLAKIVPEDGMAGDRFGTTIAVAGFRAMIGAPGADDAQPNSGKMYGFDLRFVPCAGDFNRDCAINEADIEAFWDAYERDDESADFTDDGTVNHYDFSAFLGAFNAGCP